MAVAVLIDPIFAAIIVAIPAMPILIEGTDHGTASAANCSTLDSGYAWHHRTQDSAASRTDGRTANHLVIGLAAAQRERGGCCCKKNQRFHVMSLSIQRR